MGIFFCLLFFATSFDRFRVLSIIVDPLISYDNDDKRVYTDQGHYSGQDGEQTGGRAVASGDVGKRGPVASHMAGG